MMNSSQKNSQNRRTQLGSMNFNNHTEHTDDSDENILIPQFGSKVTTSVQAGEMNDPEHSINGREDDDSSKRKPSFDESQIVRTVEVRQYEEH
jgi:hypothetical protein